MSNDFIVDRVKKVISEFVLEQEEKNNYICGYLDLSKENALTKLLDGLRIAGSVNYVHHRTHKCLFNDWHPGKMAPVNKRYMKDKLAEDGELVNETHNVEVDEDGNFTSIKNDDVPANVQTDQLQTEDNAEGVPMRELKPSFMWSHPIIPLKDVPFLMMTVRTFSCCFGKNNHQNTKKDSDDSAITLAMDTSISKDADTSEDVDYDDLCGEDIDIDLVSSIKTDTKKKRASSSFKYSCPAIIDLREFKTFPLYKRNKNLSAHRSRVLRKRLYDDVMQGKAKTEMRAYISIPLPAAHENHPTGANMSMKLRMHPLIKKKIYETVADGIIDIKAIKSVLRQYVNNELCADGMRPLLDNRSYFPTDKMINCHRLIATRYSADQLHMIKLQQQIHIWQKHFANSKIFLCNENEIHTSAQPDLAQYNSQGFLFIYQDAWQSDLLQQYGSVCYFDAAHRYVKGYDFKLYTLYVKVKEQIYLSAMIVNLEDSSDALIDCIRVLLCWNPLWQPEHISADFCYTLLVSLQIIFPATEIAVNDVIRTREFEHWADLSSDSDVRIVFDHLNKMIISKTCVEEELNKLIIDLSVTNLWQTSAEFREWVERCFSHYLQYVVANTSRIMKEEIHRLLKQKRLRFPDGQNIVLPLANLSLSNVLGYMITEHVQDVRQLMLMKHGDVLHESQILVNVPQYLENRPKPFIRHCMLQIAVAKLFTMADITPLASESKTYSVALFPGCQVRTLCNLIEPQCECNVWQLTNNPCTHIFATFELCGENWNSLPSEYVNNPRINILVLREQEPLVKTEISSLIEEYRLMGHDESLNDENEDEDVNFENMIFQKPDQSVKNIVSSILNSTITSDAHSPRVDHNSTVNHKALAPNCLIDEDLNKLSDGCVPDILNDVSRLPNGQSIIWVTQDDKQVPYLVIKKVGTKPVIKALELLKDSKNSLNPKNNVQPHQKALLTPAQQNASVLLADISNPNEPVPEALKNLSVLPFGQSMVWVKKNGKQHPYLVVKETGKRPCVRPLVVVPKDGPVPRGTKALFAVVKYDAGNEKSTSVSQSADSSDSDSHSINSDNVARTQNFKSDVQLKGEKTVNLELLEKRRSSQLQRPWISKLLGRISESDYTVTDRKSENVVLMENNLNRKDDMDITSKAAIKRKLEEELAEMTARRKALKTTDVDIDATVFDEASKVRTILSSCIGTSYKVKDKALLLRVYKMSHEILSLLNDHTVPEGESYV